MTSPASPAFRAHFAALRDLRQEWKILYPLQEVLLVALSRTIADAEDFVEIGRRDLRHLNFLRRFLRLPLASPVTTR